MADLLRYSLKVPKEEICYMSWTIDGYEGVAFLRNDAEDGMVSVLCPEDNAAETEKIISAFESEGIAIERLGVFSTEDK
ncbi:MAG: DUF4911 domain-containing protein [Synergistaceae bacterium]|jgi:hypothetical protein|nr:DUF4911 domain-containing protein [Synergistaceae bacterium]